MARKPPPTLASGVMIQMAEQLAKMADRIVKLEAEMAKIEASMARLADTKNDAAMSVMIDIIRRLAVENRGEKT